MKSCQIISKTKIYSLITNHQGLFEIFRDQQCMSGLGPGPGWGPVRVGAHMDPYGPLWAHKGPYGPIWARFCLKNHYVLMKKHEIINQNIEVVQLEIVKVKTWFGDKEL